MADKKTLVQKRGRVKGALTRLKGFAEGISDTTTAEDISIRFETLEEAWKEFRAIEDILLLIEDQQSEIEENEQKYFEAKSLMLRALNARQPRANQENVDLNSTMNQLFAQQQSFFNNLDRSQTTSNSVRLPKLSIPLFSGDYKEWPSFKDLFEAAFNGNQLLSGSQKFQYLKGLLKGSPAGLIRHLPVTDVSFTEAWEKLKKRYDKPSHITTSFIRTFMDLSSLSNPSTKALRNMCDMCDEVIRGLKSLGKSAEARDPWLIYIISTKIDSETRELWSQETAEKEFPTFDEFLAFLNKRCDALESANIGLKKSPHSIKTLHSSVSSKVSECPKCTADHPVYQCPEFKAETPDKRKAFVITKSLCFRCLGINHSVKKCFSKLRCQRCKGNHHSLLHDTYPKTSTVKGGSPSNPNPTNPNASINMISSINSLPSINPEQLTCSSDSSINSDPASRPGDSQLSSLNTYADKPRESFATVALLPTALCKVKDVNGYFHSCRILLDSGSQLSLISDKFAQRLKLKRQNARLAVSGLASVGVGQTKGKICLDIFPRWEKSQKIQVVAFIMDNLTSYVPTKPAFMDSCDFLHSVKLADPEFDKPSSIDIILGADKFFEVLCEGKLYDSKGHSIAHNTIFGWVMAGISPASHTSALSMSISLLTDLDKTLQCFWKIDEMGLDAVPLSGEEMKAEQHFQSTSTRAVDGRYVVSIPLREDRRPLGHSQRNAALRLQSIERRFAKDMNYKNAYISFMREYEQLGHMEQVPESDVKTDDNHHFISLTTPFFKRLKFKDTRGIRRVLQK